MVLSKRSRNIIAGTSVLVLMLTCFFLWFVYQSPVWRVILNWVRDSKTAAADKIAFSALIVSFIGVLISVVTPGISVLVGYFAAIAGAKYGAKSAFDLGHRQQMQDLDDKRYAALIETQYALISQWNIIDGIRQHHLEPVRTDKFRFLSLPLIYMPDVALRVPFADIIYIAEPGIKDSPESLLANPNLLQRIHWAEQTYTAVIVTVDLFRKDKEIFNAKFVFASAPKPEEKDTASLRHNADWLYKHVDSSLMTIGEINIEIGHYIQRRFPKRGALKINALEAKGAID